MRTLVVIVGGILLWVVTMGLARLLHIHASSSWTPLGIFAAVWLVISGWNVWIGVTQAGYTFWEELPIFLLTYLLPVAVAVFIRLR
ncbi:MULTISPECIES: hypothetical protein [Marinobacter]|uniref:hypothetical protein n=1 Tax=Marinobacter TaxID=2742 RepID=UPI001926BFD5|nr:MULTISPECIES: hypothetical protein [Marinobacter]MBL3824259.1 hypothetical protein [Marinobacter sp. MC3]MBL3892649.1 hypothetical protein [Marinobacter sp. MW3]MCD1647536.1 hypothetical protein [Marinobacter adhaerens]